MGIWGGACFRGKPRLCILHKCVARFVSDSLVSCNMYSSRDECTALVVFNEQITLVLLKLGGSKIKSFLNKKKIK